MIGNGGFAGDALDNPGRVAQRNEALKLGFAFAQTNTGHDAGKEPGATFVLSNPQKAIDYAYRAVHLTAKTTKAIAKEYYGKSISHAYWNSCSNGGRQGLIEAQRFVDDFDGIVVASPWVDQTGFTVGAIWNQKALSAVSLTPAKLALVADKVMEKCDAIDGLKDGLIDDPRKCNFDPARDVPACSAGSDSPGLPDRRAGSGRLPRSTADRRATANLSSPAIMPGSEAVVSSLFGGGTGSAWLNVIVTTQPDRKPADFNLAEGTIRYLAPKPPKPDYDYQTFDFDRDIHLLGRLEQTGGREEPRFVEIQEARRKAADDVRMGGLDPSAHDGRELLRAGRGQERSGYDEVLPPIYGAGYGALRRRCRAGSARCDDGDD